MLSESDRRLTRDRAVLACVTGCLSQARDGLNGEETNGLAVILGTVRDDLEAVHQEILAPRTPG